MGIVPCTLGLGPRQLLPNSLVPAGPVDTGDTLQISSGVARRIRTPTLEILCPYCTQRLAGLPLDESRGRVEISNLMSGAASNTSSGG